MRFLNHASTLKYMTMEKNKTARTPTAISGSLTTLIVALSIPITSSTKNQRKNHKGITFDDLRKGWFVEIKKKIEKNENRTTKEVKVKVDRLKKVELDAFLEGLEISESIKCATAGVP